MPHNVTDPRIRSEDSWGIYYSLSQHWLALHSHPKMWSYAPPSWPPLLYVGLICIALFLNHYPFFLALLQRRVLVLMPEVMLWEVRGLLSPKPKSSMCRQTVGCMMDNLFYSQLLSSFICINVHMGIHPHAHAISCILLLNNGSHTIHRELPFWYDLTPLHLSCSRVSLVVGLGSLFPRCIAMDDCYVN